MVSSEANTTKSETRRNPYNHETRDTLPARTIDERDSRPRPTKRPQRTGQPLRYFESPANDFCRLSTASKDEYRQGYFSLGFSPTRQCCPIGGAVSFSFPIQTERVCEPKPKPRTENPKPKTRNPNLEATYRSLPPNTRGHPSRLRLTLLRLPTPDEGLYR